MTVYWAHGIIMGIKYLQHADDAVQGQNPQLAMKGPVLNLQDYFKNQIIEMAKSSLNMNFIGPSAYINQEIYISSK